MSANSAVTVLRSPSRFFRGGRVSYSNRRIIRFLCRGSRRGRSERRAALSTKAFARWIIGTALRTKIRECRAAITAELLASWIFSFAIPATHRLTWKNKRSALHISPSAAKRPAGSARTIFPDPPQKVGQDSTGVDKSPSWDQVAKYPLIHLLDFRRSGWQVQRASRQESVGKAFGAVASTGYCCSHRRGRVPSPRSRRPCDKSERA